MKISTLILQSDHRDAVSLVVVLAWIARSDPITSNSSDTLHERVNRQLGEQADFAEIPPDEFQRAIRFGLAGSSDDITTLLRRYMTRHRPADVKNAWYQRAIRFAIHDRPLGFGACQCLTIFKAALEIDVTSALEIETEVLGQEMGFDHVPSDIQFWSDDPDKSCAISGGMLDLYSRANLSPTIDDASAIATAIQSLPAKIKHQGQLILGDPSVRIRYRHYHGLMNSIRRIRKALSLHDIVKWQASGDFDLGTHNKFSEFNLLSAADVSLLNELSPPKPGIWGGTMNGWLISHPRLTNVRHFGCWTTPPLIIDAGDALAELNVGKERGSIFRDDPELGKLFKTPENYPTTLTLLSPAPAVVTLDRTVFFGDFAKSVQSLNSSVIRKFVEARISAIKRIKTRSWQVCLGGVAGVVLTILTLGLIGRIFKYFGIEKPFNHISVQSWQTFDFSDIIYGAIGAFQIILIIPMFGVIWIFVAVVVPHAFLPIMLNKRIRTLETALAKNNQEKSQ